MRPADLPVQDASIVLSPKPQTLNSAYSCGESVTETVSANAIPYLGLLNTSTLKPRPIVAFLGSVRETL